MTWIVVFILSGIVCGIMTMAAPKRDQARLHAVMWAFWAYAFYLFLFN